MTVRSFDIPVFSNVIDISKLAIYDLSCIMLKERHPPDSVPSLYAGLKKTTWQCKGRHSSWMHGGKTCPGLLLQSRAVKVMSKSTNTAAVQRTRLSRARQADVTNFQKK